MKALYVFEELIFNLSDSGRNFPGKIGSWFDFIFPQNTW